MIQTHHGHVKPHEYHKISYTQTFCAEPHMFVAGAYVLNQRWMITLELFYRKYTKIEAPNIPEPTKIIQEFLKSNHFFYELNHFGEIELSDCDTLLFNVFQVTFHSSESVKILCKLSFYRLPM